MGSNPIQRLHVAGNQILTGDLDLYGADINLGTGSATTTLTSANTNLGIATTSPSARLSVTSAGTGTGRAFVVADSSNTERFTILDNGNVGIGTTSPTTLFSVTGGNGTYITSGGRIGVGVAAPAVPLHIVTSGDGAGVRLQTLSPARTYDMVVENQVLYVKDAGNDRLNFNPNGLTTFASTRLAINATPGSCSLGDGGDFSASSGTIGVCYIQQASVGDARMEFYSGAGLSTVISQSPLGRATVFNEASQDIDFRIEGDNNQNLFFVDASTDRIGIGTSTPNWLLQVAATRPFFALTDTSAGTNLKHWTLSSQGGNLYIATSSDALATSSVPALTLLSNGNVGIGTSTPGARLSIEGSCVDTGSGCADIAELYSASEPVEPGDIVAVDPSASQSATVKRATEEDTVIGVVSTNPAIAIEGSALQLLTGSRYQNNPSKPAIALAGRVPVKVSTENGSIAVGDRIAPSSLPGVGRKANPGEAVVGIALEPFSGGDMGKILAFVNLGQSTLTAQKGTMEPFSLKQDLDLNGFSLFNVKSIRSVNNAWGLDENGRLVVREIETEMLKVQSATFGSPGKPEGITIFDTLNGEAYCVTITGGEWLKTKGECGVKVEDSESGQSDGEN